MKDIVKLICIAGVLTLSGCGGAAETGHAHDEGAAHSHDGGDPHTHAEGDHAADSPATEAFYADDAAAVEQSDPAEQPKATGEDEEAASAHAHGDGEPHTHDH